MTPEAPQDQPPPNDDNDATGPDSTDDLTRQLPDGSTPTGSMGPANEDSLGDVGLDPVRNDHDDPDPLIGTVIGGARILRLIGQGGMGRVYEGYQDHLSLTVAVKVMRPGLVVSPEMRKRFEREAKILAQLRHEGIARIYSAGVQSLAGAPGSYFIMEFIPGARTLNRYAEDLKLTTRARLDLFQSVCDAVAHGHKQGVVHRDLKPGNILVDKDGNPKIIDFGVAKATDSDLAITTMQTDVGQLIGSLWYMSPEQMMGDPNLIDVRCDVYALGIVLYELLTNRMPYNLREKALLEVMRIVKEDDPTPISAFNRTLKGDVAVIAGKCLEKEPTRRYASADALGADVALHLAGEPIKARPPSFVDSVRRLARKHRAAAAATAGVFAALVAAVIGITYFYLQAMDQRKIAIANERAASLERDRSKRVLDFLQEAFSAPDPTRIGREITVADVLMRLAKETPARFPDDPLTEAEVLSTIAETLASLGLYIAAEDPAQRALSLIAPSIADTDAAAGRLRVHALQTLAGIRLFQERLPEAATIFRDATRLARADIEKNPSSAIRINNGLALTLIRRALFDEALEVLDESQKLIEQHRLEQTREAIETAQFRFIANQRLGSADEPEIQLIESVLEQSQRLLGAEDRKTAEILNEAAVAYRQASRYQEAEKLLKEALRIDEKLLGPEHWDVSKVLNNLAVLYRNTGRLDEAESALRRSLTILDRQFGPEYHGKWIGLHVLARVKHDQKNLDEAEELVRKAILILEKQNPCDPRVQAMHPTLFQILRQRGDDAAIAKELARAWSTAAGGRDCDPRQAEIHLDRLFFFSLLMRKPDFAIPAFEQALAADATTEAADPSQRVLRLSQMSQLLCLVPNPRVAESRARAAWNSLPEDGDTSVASLTAACALGETLLMLGCFDDADAILEKAIAGSRSAASDKKWLIARLYQLAAECTDLKDGPAKATPRYEEAEQVGRTILGLDAGGFVVFFSTNPLAFGEEKNLTSFLISEINERRATLNIESSQDLVKHALQLIEARRYTQAECELRQAVVMTDGEKNGAGVALQELLALMGREEKQ